MFPVKGQHKCSGVDPIRESKAVMDPTNDHRKTYLTDWENAWKAQRYMLQPWIIVMFSTQGECTCGLRMLMFRIEQEEQYFIFHLD